MPANSPAKLTSLSYLGMAVETTQGTPVAPTGFIPVLTFKPQDTLNYVEDKGYRGTPYETYGEYLGVTSSTYDIDGDAYPSSIGNLLGSIFGLDTVTGTTPYTHTFTGAATPGTLTLGDYYVAGFRSWPGSKCNKLTFKFTPEAGLTYTASFVGWPSATGTAPSTQTFTTLPFFLGWEAALTLAGTSDAQLTSLTLDIERMNSKPLFSANNSKNPFDIFVGPIRVTWQLEFYMTTDTEYDYALTQASQIVSVLITEQSSSDTLTFTSSAVQFTKPTIVRGQAFVEASLDGTAIYNATDSGVLQCILKNGVSASYTTTCAS